MDSYLRVFHPFAHGGAACVVALDDDAFDPLIIDIIIVIMSELDEEL